MTISKVTTHLGGKEIRPYAPGIELSAEYAYRVALDWERYEADESITDILDALLADPKAAELTALSIGDWGGTAEGNDSKALLSVLVRGAGRLPKLEALFIGDMIYEECEISWINQTDMSELYGAFPNLLELRLRGGTGLSLGHPKHQTLRTLVVETGGLDAEILHQLAKADLPSLEHLELWLGDDGYGWTGQVDHVRPLLFENPFPKLKYLGLRNSQIADEIAELAVDAPVLQQLDTLDLSLGTMTDRGAAALSEASAIRSLKRLDLHHHFMTGDGLARLNALGIEVDVRDQQDQDDDYRFVAVSE